MIVSLQLSIIIPFYKVERYLRQCIDSILAQTFTEFELLLIDDGSPDGCPAICDEYAGKEIAEKEPSGLLHNHIMGNGAAESLFSRFH